MTIDPNLIPTRNIVLALVGKIIRRSHNTSRGPHSIMSAHTSISSLAALVAALAAGLHGADGHGILTKPISRAVRAVRQILLSQFSSCPQLQLARLFVFFCRLPESIYTLVESCLADMFRSKLSVFPNPPAPPPPRPMPLPCSRIVGSAWRVPFFRI
jgi:hypothetical protein